MSWILFFDGDCAFCSASVRRVVRFDQRGNINYAPLQGKLAGEKGFSHYAAAEGGTMVLLRESDGQVFTRSDAWIELARALGGAWKLLTITRFIPRCIRDFMYDLVANNRYRLIRKSDTCALPDPVLLSRLRE